MNWTACQPISFRVLWYANPRHIMAGSAARTECTQRYRGPHEGGQPGVRVRASPSGGMAPPASAAQYTAPIPATATAHQRRCSPRNRRSTPLTVQQHRVMYAARGSGIGNCHVVAPQMLRGYVSEVTFAHRLVHDRVRSRRETAIRRRRELPAPYLRLYYSAARGCCHPLA